MTISPQAPAVPARRRFKASDVPEYLDMQAIGQLFLALSIHGYIRLLDAVWTQQSGSLKALLEALEGARTEGLSQVAHSFKSEAGGLGLKALSELARDIEQNAAGYSPETCKEMAVLLHDRWDNTLALCERMGLRLQVM